MYDILPPGVNPDHDVGGEMKSARGRGTVPARGHARPTVHTISSPVPKPLSRGEANRIVRVNWKLPARLRKPIRQQLKDEREKRRRKQRVIQFSRRRIATKPLLVSASARPPDGRQVTLPTKRAFNRGAEHHTGDMYRYTKPRLQVALPPYVSAIAPERKGLYAAVRHRGERVRGSRRPHDVSLVQQERDMPFAWEEYREKPGSEEAHGSGMFTRVDSQTSGKQKQRMVLPIVMSFLPYSIAKFFGAFRQKAGASIRSGIGFKKKLRLPVEIVNLAILCTGCIIASGLVWNLQGAGRGMSVISSLEQKTRTAMSEMTKAQSAMADSEFEQSILAFNRAETLLGAAQEELDNALAASKQILEIVDITGTVRSSQRVLDAAYAMSKAGKHMSAGISDIAGSTVIVTAEDSKNTLTLVDAISLAIMEFKETEEQLAAAEEALQDVGSPFLPADIQAQVDTLASSIPKIRQLLSKITNGSDALLYVLGNEMDREYVMLFANNHEIRPVGGFIGTVGLINVDRGQIENIDIQSVYDPDGQLKEFIAPPNPLLPIVDRWYMRDANWFVDYRKSAQKVAEFFEKEGGPTVDGVILFTPQVLQHLLSISGPIPMPAYGKVVSAENFIEVTQKEVTYSYDKEVNRPKQFLADLTPLLLNRLFNEPSSKFEVLSTLGESFNRKEILIYVRDEDVQRKVDELGWSGVFPQNAQGFLHVNNANIGGHKSDQFIDQEVDVRTRIDTDGDAEVTVTIRRTHYGPNEKAGYAYPPDDNPAFKDNIVYQRVFVPPKAQLVEAHGFASPSEIPKMHIPEVDVPLVGDPDVVAWQSQQRSHPSGTAIGEEAGYTYFANWVITKPGETSVSLYRYRLSRYAHVPGLFDPADRYSVYYAKQPGEMRSSLRIAIEIPEHMKYVHTIPESGVTTDGARTVVYRTDVQKDAIFGVVYEYQR